MRIAGYIERAPFHVTVFEMNHRFSIKIEYSGLEQWYKIRPSDKLNTVSDIEFILGDKFWSGVEEVFTAMKNNEISILESISADEEEDFDIL